MQQSIQINKKIFAEAILSGRNQGQSYSKAYSRKTCGKYEQNRGCKMAKDPEIIHYIQERHDEIVAREAITTDKIIKRMWDIANDPETKCSSKVSALAYLGKWMGLKGVEETKKGDSIVNIQIINYKDVPNDRKKLWRGLSGERHSAISLSAPTVPRADMERVRERGDENSPSGSPEKREGLGHVEQGNKKSNV